MVKYRMLKRKPIYGRVGGHWYSSVAVIAHQEYHIARYSSTLKKYVTLVILTNKESAEATLKYFKELKDVQFND